VSAPDESWDADWRAARARTYAEEGIPMILALEAPGAPEPGLAEALRRAAAAPEAQGARAAAVLEVMALREMRRLDGPGA
jgi:hypothetical protein